MDNNPYQPIGREILAIEPQTHDEYLYRLAFDQPLSPGQFFQISLPKIGEAPFSIAAIGKHHGSIDVLIRRVGRLTGPIIDDLKVGDKLFMRGPYGIGFDYKKLNGTHLILVAGGSGVAPVLPLATHYTAHKGKAASLQIIFGYKNKDTILFRDKVEKWRNQGLATLTLDDNRGAPDYPQGLVTQYIPDLKLPEDPSQVKAVTVGPPIMMDFVVKEFLKLNIPKENIFVSYERNMSCGVGKCGHCRMDTSYVCVDGPVYSYNEAEKLRD